MSKVEQTLVGSYQRHGTLLKGRHIDLLIANRAAAKQSQNKTSQFMLAISKPIGHRTYLSSIYETRTPGIYEIEHGGHRYLLELGQTQAHIQHKKLS